MTDQFHIQIYAASAARRARIAELVRRSVKQASIACVASLSQPAVNDAPPDVWIADLDTASAATILLNALKEWPDGFGLVVLIDDPDSRWVREALNAGVNAIIARMPDPEELRLAIEAAEARLVLLHPSSARELAAGNLIASEPDFEQTEHLTAREREILLLIGEGLGNKEIASRLGISEHTAKFHISSILGKLRVSSRAEAVSQGIRRGLIPI